MSTATKTARAGADHIQRLERKIEQARRAYSELPGADSYDQLLNIIHHPGWTTIAEVAFLEGALESLTRQMQIITEAQKQLINAARAVGVNAG